MVMLLRVEIHPGFLLEDGLLGYRHPPAATCSTGGLDEYHAAPPHRRPVAVLLNLKGRIMAARGARGR